MERSRPYFSVVTFIAVFSVIAFLSCVIFGFFLESNVITMKSATVEFVGRLAAGLFSVLAAGISGYIALSAIRADRSEQREIATQSLAAGLAAELDDTGVIFFNRAERIRRIVSESSTEEDNVTIKFNYLQHISTQIYESNASNLGLLGADMVHMTVILYGRAYVWKSYIERKERKEQWLRIAERHDELSIIFRKHSKTLRKIAHVTDDDIEFLSGKNIDPAHRDVLRTTEKIWNEKSSNANVATL